MELYKKVEIKSQENLPEKSTEYWAHFVSNFRALALVKGINLKSGEFDWYLQPVEMPTEEETEEAIKELGKESTAPDKETPDWMLSDIRRGINWLKNKLTKT